MSAILARIVARYLAGALVAYGLIPHEVGQELAMDPDVALVLGAAISAVTEAVYAIAKRKGWTT